MDSETKAGWFTKFIRRQEAKVKIVVVSLFYILTISLRFFNYPDLSSLPKYLFFIQPDTTQTLIDIINLIVQLWWLWIYIGLFLFARQLWLAYRMLHYKKNIKWSIMELRIPREVRKTPRAMEQVFMSIHSLRNSAGNPKETWWDGEVTYWFSAEIVSFGGEIHFYMRVPKARRSVIEAALYAQYQDIEIIDTEDYIDRIPADPAEIQKMGYDFFGTELALDKPDEYPIHTYMDFETVDEDKQLDPISATLEILGKLTSRETVWIQILFRPVTDWWKKEGEKTIDRLKKKFRSQSRTEQGTFIVTTPAPGELELLKVMDRAIGKPGYESLIRYVYFAPKEIYTDTFPRRGLLGAFNQYASESLNKFTHNFRKWTRADYWNKPHVFPQTRLKARKKRMLADYRIRRMLNEIPMLTFLDSIKESFFSPGFKAEKKGKMILNVEELATIFHLPTFTVLTAPLIKRADSRKVGPPAGLPIYSEDESNLPGLKAK